MVKSLLLLSVLASADGRPPVLDAVAGPGGESGGAGAPEISTRELQAEIDARRVLIFDARSPAEFATGHLPGALNVAGKPGLPPSQYTSDIGPIERLVKGNRAQPIVLYCNGLFCGRSKRLADDLLAASFTSVRRYQLGMPVWRALGGVQQIELSAMLDVLEADRTAVLLDARGRTALRGARPLSLEDVRKAKDDGRLPMDDHHTRILVVGSSAAQARALAEGAARAAFDNVSFFARDAALVERAMLAAEERRERDIEVAPHLGAAPVSLAQALAASDPRGTPLSAKYELEKDRLQLSVYTERDGRFQELIVDHRTGKLLAASPITDGEDLQAALAQRRALGAAHISLETAVKKAETANGGFRAVSATPALDADRAVTEVVLLRGSESRLVRVVLD